MPTAQAHYPPLPSAATTRPSASRWSPEASLSTSPVSPSVALPSPPPPHPAPPSPTTLRAGILAHAHSLLGSATAAAAAAAAAAGPGSRAGSGSGSVRGDAGGQGARRTDRAGAGEEPEGDEEDDEFRYEERELGSEGSWKAAASAAQEGGRGATSRWAAAAAGGATAASAGAGEVAPADSDPHTAPREGAGAGASAARWLARAEAVRARSSALSTGSRALAKDDEPPATARPSTPDRAAGRSRTATADSANTLSTSSFLSSPFSLVSSSASPPTSRDALLADAASTRASTADHDLRAAQTRIVSLERALSAHSASDRMRADALEMREASLESDLKRMRDDAARRDGELRAAQGDAERTRAQLERCVALLVATEGVVGALEGQEAAGRAALELVGEALDLGVELHGAAHDAATRAAELDRALVEQGTVGERMKGLLLAMRRDKVELEGRVRERDEELAALRARDERHGALLRRVYGALAQLDGDVLLEPVGDERAAAADPAAQVEAALSRLADLRDRTPTCPRTASPASSATTSDPLSALSHANEELQAELAEAGVTAERRIKLLVREIQKVTATKDAEIAELRRRVDEATRAADEAQRRRVYPPHELVRLSSSPLVASSAPQLVQDSLPDEIVAPSKLESIAGTSQSLARIVAVRPLSLSSSLRPTSLCSSHSLLTLSCSSRNSFRSSFRLYARASPSSRTTFRLAALSSARSRRTTPSSSRSTARRMQSWTSSPRRSSKREALRRARPERERERQLEKVRGAMGSSCLCASLSLELARAREREQPASFSLRERRPLSGPCARRRGRAIVERAVRRALPASATPAARRNRGRRKPCALVLPSVRCGALRSKRSLNPFGSGRGGLGEKSILDRAQLPAQLLSRNSVDSRRLSSQRERALREVCTARISISTDISSNYVRPSASRSCSSTSQRQSPAACSQRPRSSRGLRARGRGSTRGVDESETRRTERTVGLLLGRHGVPALGLPGVARLVVEVCAGICRCEEERRQSA